MDRASPSEGEGRTFESCRVRQSFQGVSGELVRMRKALVHRAGSPNPLGHLTPPSELLPVHPRACGEHKQLAEGESLIRGSSPRLRGTRIRQPYRARARRFIPAPAGNTPFTFGPQSSPAVHPRACGEHMKIIRTNDGRTGSSPRLRGTPAPHLLGGQSDRFIPAPAGNTWHGRTRRYQAAVHPRACGEHDRLNNLETGVIGSSPRLRGTRQRIADPRSARRFIPAPAGNTIGSRSATQCASVHPRACGEHRVPLCTALHVPGSSPRLRGTRLP